jgi:hypothetical protein
MDETTEERLAALERALTDGDHDLEALAEAGDIAARVEQLEADRATQEERIAELEAATQALRGYVGNVRAVNEDVRQQADRALELAERTGGDGAGERTGSGDTHDEEPTLELEDCDESSSPATGRPSVTHDEVSEQGRDRRAPTGDRTHSGHATDASGDHRGDDTCPLCDGDGTRDRSGRDSATGTQSRGGAGTNLPTTGTRARSESTLPGNERGAGVTDGGTVTQDGDSEHGDMLQRIRDLL